MSEIGAAFKTLRVSLSAVLLAGLAGLPLGALIATTELPGRRALIVLLNGLWGCRPVVVGLTVYLLLSRAGPLGSLGMLFTPGAMVFPGGASGGVLPASLGDVPLDFDTLTPYGSFIGSAAIIVLSQHDSAKRAALNAMRFFVDESCGQCTPCRIGTAKAVKLTEHAGRPA